LRPVEPKRHLASPAVLPKEDHKGNIDRGRPTPETLYGHPGNKGDPASLEGCCLKMALIKKPGTVSPIALSLFSVWILWGFGVQTVYARLKLELDGVVISARDVPSRGAPRYASEYTLRGAGGGEVHYVAGPTDASLPRSMPVGTHLRKARWHFSYERNGKEVNDFPLFFYLAFLGIAVACMGWGLASAWSRAA
jgi:hypothetical protein